MITSFTITGADNSIHPSELIRLSNKYPFVEWGILVSKKRFGTNRFPDKDWLNNLFTVKCKNYQVNIELSCHLCGEYVRKFCMGNNDFIHEIGYLWIAFKRVQLNFHGELHEYIEKQMSDLILKSRKEIIFQLDGVNVDMFHHINKHTSLSGLFDLSAGTGILPEKWDPPLFNSKCGYAGGLSPENLEQQIIAINKITGTIPVWIDMETHVRSDNDRTFDMDKVEKCLNIASKYIKV